MTKYSDKEIVEVLQTGDSLQRNNIIRQFYNDCYDQVVSFVLKNSGSKEQSADLFQDAMEVFYNQIILNKFQGNSTIYTYFIGIARNLWFSQLRKRKTPHLDLASEFHLIDDELETGNQNLQLFYTLFEQLENECKTILKLYYFDDLSAKEIIGKFDTLKNEQSVRTKKYRCLKYLKTIFKKNKVNKGLNFSK